MEFKINGGLIPEQLGYVVFRCGGCMREERIFFIGSKEDEREFCKIATPPYWKKVGGRNLCLACSLGMVDDRERST